VKNKEQWAERKRDYLHACLEYRIRCTHLVAKLAPLPEFLDVVAVLRMYRDGRASRRDLKRVYKNLRSGKNMKLAVYGYSTVGEIYRGLLGILHDTLHPTLQIWNGHCRQFAEARYCAVNAIGPLNALGIDNDGRPLADVVRQAECAYQCKQFKETLGAFHAKWDGNKSQAAA
jgi:hypothetical protein